MAKNICLKSFFYLLIIFLISSCSLLLPKTEQAYVAERAASEKIKSSQNAKIHAEAIKVFENRPNQAGLDAAIGLCKTANEIVSREECYQKLFPQTYSYVDCEKLKKNEEAQHVCFVDVFRRHKIDPGSARYQCKKNKICERAFLSTTNVYDVRDPYFETAKKEFFAHEKAKSAEIQKKFTYSSSERSLLSDINYNFYEVFYVGVKTNQSISFGYDFNLPRVFSMPVGLGVSLYDVKENIRSVDFAVSDVDKNWSVRLAIGARFQDDKNTKYHAGWGIGIKGLTLYLEGSSDFKKDSEFVIGLLYLARIPR